MSDIVERQIDAYYYSFVPTGVAAVDKVLGAVACAGKAYHHTDNWCEDTPAYDDHTGPTPVDWIQNAALEAADEITALRAENEKLRAALNERCPVDAMDQEGMTPAQAAIWHVWGERCSDFEPECITCRAWAELSQIERLRAALSTARADALEEAAKCAETKVKYGGWDAEARIAIRECAAAIRALKEGK